MPTPDRPKGRVRLILATVLPGLAAGAAVLVLGSASAGEVNTAQATQSAETLARITDLGPRISGEVNPRSTPRGLAPVIATAGHVGIQASPLESLQGGIRPAPPQRISIPTAGVDAVVEPVEAHGGAIRVPSPGRAGWYEEGPRPGEVGRAVILGHVDRRDSPGLFSRVPRLPAGARIELTDRRGEVRRFKVVGVAQRPKDRFPAEYVYGSARGPVLVLITCGGPFRKGRGYRDNVLLFAETA